MTRWEAFTTVCSHLRAGLLGGEHPHQAEITWELIIEVASFHYATPTLAACFDPHIDIPGDVGAYFESALALNEKRNEQILSTLARVAGLLNAIDIEPVLLKGAALLVEGIYPQPSMRIMGDIDILIPKNRSAEACAALKAAGYETKSTAVSPPTHHHLPMLLAYRCYQPVRRCRDRNGLVLRDGSTGSISRSAHAAAGTDAERRSHHLSQPDFPRLIYPEQGSASPCH
jgi:hypothetical protein